MHCTKLRYIFHANSIVLQAGMRLINNSFETQNYPPKIKFHIFLSYWSNLKWIYQMTIFFHTYIYIRKNEINSISGAYDQIVVWMDSGLLFSSILRVWPANANLHITICSRSFIPFCIIRIWIMNFGGSRYLRVCLESHISFFYWVDDLSRTIWFRWFVGHLERLFD